MSKKYPNKYQKGQKEYHIEIQNWYSLIDIQYSKKVSVDLFNKYDF